MSDDRDRPSGRLGRVEPGDVAPDSSERRPDDDPPPFAGDQPVRRGSVDLRLRDGERVHHDEAFVRYEPDAFVVATDSSFSGDTTDHYPKETVAWIEVRHPRH